MTEVLDERPAMKCLFGTHHLLVDGDVVSLNFDGELHTADFHQLVQHLDEHVPAPQQFFLIAWAEKLTNVSAETRSIARKWEGFRRLRGDVTVGAPLLTRAIGTLAMRAIQLYLRHEFPYSFVNTEQEARAWVARIRTQQEAVGCRS